MSEEFDLYAKDEDPRSEKTLSAILGNYDGELDKPESRVEAYLLAIKEMLEEGGGGGGGSVTVDTELKPNSTNPVQNKAIKAEIDKLYGDVNTLYGEVRGTLTAKVNQLEGAQSQTNTQLSNLDADYQNTKNMVAQHNGEISGMNSHLNGVDSALNSAFSMVDGLQSQVDGLEPRVSSSEQALTVNLLNPALESKTANGVTVTRNADNTYTLNGTSTQNTYFKITEFAPTSSQNVRITGCPQGGNQGTFYFVVQKPDLTDTTRDFGDGATKELLAGESYYFVIAVKPGTVCDNLVFKPMITTNLSATYDDYVPYSGSSGNLNTDYADLQGKINESNNDISDIKGYIGYTEDDIYGVEVDFVNKRFTRLAAAVNKTPGADFDNVEPWKRRRCNLTDDGVVTAYYGDAAYTETGALEQAVEVDGVTYAIGTAVQVMVEQPKFYYKVVPVKLEKLPDNNGYQMRKARYYVSGTPKAGFKLHPAFIRDNEEAVYIYLSAYEGCTYDVSASAYNVDDAQTVDFAVSTGDKLASIAGAKPTSGLSQSATRAGFRKLAHNRGDGWEQAYAATISCTQLLMLIEYASFNMQSEIAKGVCEISDNSSYNCSSLTGSTSSLGNTSGRAASTINTKGSTSTTETVDGKTSMTYRGEENPYSNIWIFIDGVNAQNPSQFTSGYTTHLYVADHDFADDTATGYEDTGIHPCYGEGYISAFGYSEDYDWLFIPTELLGNSTIPIGDYDWNKNTGWHVARLGGRWNGGLRAGAFCWNLDSASSSRSHDIGGRLVYFKKKQTA